MAQREREEERNSILEGLSFAKPRLLEPFQVARKQPVLSVAHKDGSVFEVPESRTFEVPLSKTLASATLSHAPLLTVPHKDVSVLEVPENRVFYHFDVPLPKTLASATLSPLLRYLYQVYLL